MEKPKRRPPRPPVLRDPPRVIKSKFRFFLVLLLFFTVAGSFYWFVRSDYFAVEKIEVRGQIRLEEEHVLKSTGLVPGVNIWQIDIIRVEEHLLTNRRIRSVYVQKYLPDTVIIQITEYGPLALAPTLTGFAEIDENQTVMAFTDNISHIDLPIITGVLLEDPEVGIKAVAPQLEAALECALESRDEDYLGLVEINIDENDSITLVTQEGIRIMLGRSSTGFRKAFDVVKPILNDIRTNQASVQYIDMRAPDKPVVKMK